MEPEAGDGAELLNSQPPPVLGFLGFPLIKPDPSENN